MVKLGGPQTAPRHQACRMRYTPPLCIRGNYSRMVITHVCFTRPGGSLPSLSSCGSRERWGPLVVAINLLSTSRFPGGLTSRLCVCAFVSAYPPHMYAPTLEPLHRLIRATLYCWAASQSATSSSPSNPLPPCLARNKDRLCAQDGEGASLTRRRWLSEEGHGKSCSLSSHTVDVIFIKRKDL